MPNQLNIHGRGDHFRCFWLDNAGDQPWSDLAGYNFDAIPNAQFDWKDTTSGSYALSDNFHVNAGQTVNAVVVMAAGYVKPFFEFGFALLVQGTTVVDVLFALRPDGSNLIGDQLPADLASPSAGVLVDFKTKTAAGIVLNNVNYGPAGPASDNTSVYLSSQCAPAAGDYQILFGMFTAQNLANPARPSAMIVPFFNVT